MQLSALFTACRLAFCALAISASAALGQAQQDPPQKATEQQQQQQEPQERPRLDVIFVPTPQAAVDRMLEIARVGPEDFVIDLGSGDGRIAISAGKRGARAMGVDLDPQRIAEAKKNLEASGVSDRVTFVQQNLFDTDLSKATVLTMYLLPDLNLKLRPRILELKPGTRVVSHDFTMGDWQADRYEVVAGRDIFFWVVPARVDGRWRLQSGDRKLDLSLRQRFQQVRGTARVGGRDMRLRRVKLRGNEIEFTLRLGGRRLSFEGTVDGQTMKGTPSRRGREWTAARE